MEAINVVISLESGSGVYPVRICEEQLVFSSCRHLDSHTSDELHGSGGQSVGVSVFAHGRVEGEAEVAPNQEGAVDILADVDKDQRVISSEGASGGSLSWQHALVVAETVESLGNSNSNAGSDKMVIPESSSAQKCNDDSGVRLDGQLDGHVATSGYMKSLSGPVKSWPEVHLKVCFCQAQLGELVLGGPIGPYPSQGIGYGLVGQNFSHPKALDLEGNNKELDKGPSKQLMNAATSARKKARHRNRSWKLPFSARRRGHSKAVARRNSQKEALFRSASVALSRSLANRDNSRSRGSARILNEAQATLCMGKLLGVEFGQDEASIVNRIVQLEQQDKEKVGVRIGSPR
ncbi:hypothetical protein CsSME_00007724 [Camellia sinensis var. sinensis]